MPIVMQSVARARPTDSDGNPLTNVEFSSKNVGNLGNGLLGRALAPNTGLDPPTLNNFRHFVNQWQQSIIPKLREVLDRRLEKDMAWNPFQVI